MMNTEQWTKQKVEAVMAIDELLLRWDELEKKKKLMDESLVELKKDVSSFRRVFPNHPSR